MRYDINKYTITEKQETRENGAVTRVVTASSTYAGKPVHGYAKCHADDTFNPESGKKLAAARCNEKVAKKRLNRAERKLKEAYATLEEAKKRVAKMEHYKVDAVAEYANAAMAVVALEKDM